MQRWRWGSAGDSSAPGCMSGDGALRNNIGLLMIAVGFSGFLKSLAFSNNSVVFAISSIGEVLIYALLVHLLLSFPTGRLESRLDRILVAITYFNTTVLQLAAFVFTDPAKAGCPRCPANPLLINQSEIGRGSC